MSQKALKKRKLKFSKIIIILILLLTSVLLWSRYISTQGLIIKEYKVENKSLPLSFHGFKIVHISDIHYGRTVKEDHLINLVENINLINPDIVVFTGDLIDKSFLLDKKTKNKIINILSKINTYYGKYAISGNHDLYFKEYNDILEKSNFINLNNNFDIIYNHQYESLFLAGLESEIKGNPDISKIMDHFTDEEGVTTFNFPYKILIMHTPDTFDKIKNYNFDLVLAGHSHNGQIRLPYIGPIMKFEGSKKYYEPFYKINTTNFFISGGIGTTIVNFRFFNKPSFNFYRLTKK